MAGFNILVLGFPTQIDAERAVAKLDSKFKITDRLQVTQVGPRTPSGSRNITMLGGAADPAQARPGALVAAALDTTASASVEPDDEFIVQEWEPPKRKPYRRKKFSLALAHLTGESASFLVFPFAAGDDAKRHTSNLRSYFHNAEVTEPAVVTSFDLGQRGNVTLESIERELRSATGQPFEMRVGKAGGSYEILPLARSGQPGRQPGRSTSRGKPVTGGAGGGPDGQDPPAGQPGQPGPPGGAPVPGRTRRYIEGRCQERLKVGQPSWIAVQVAVRQPADGQTVAVDLPAAGTRVHAMLTTSDGLDLVSEPDHELAVPPHRDSGWHAWQVMPKRPGNHQAVASFHHDGEVLAALAFDLRAGQSGGTEQVTASLAIDLRPLTVRQGLLVVRHVAGALRFVALDGARQGEGVAAVAEKAFGAEQQRLVRRHRQFLDGLARAAYSGRSGADVSDRVRAIGIDLLEYLPGDIQAFLTGGLGRWQSLKIETDDDSLAWELLSVRGQGSDTFIANQLPLLRWRSGLPPPATIIGRAGILLVPGSELASARGDAKTFGAQIEALRTQLGAPAEAVVRSTGDLARRLRDAEFDLLHYTGHMSLDEDGTPSMHIGNDSFNVSRIKKLPAKTLTHRPLVFLNACATNVRAQGLAGPVGWVEDFLKAGAGSFIGTNWTVRASTAARFAEHFYDALLGGSASSLAAASALARKETAAKEADWAPLAYTIYGHPQAAMTGLTEGTDDVPAHHG